MKAGPGSITYISVMTANLQQAICSSLRCFSCGTPSRKATLRNVAAVSRLAEQTPQRPCLPSLLSSSPPCLSPSHLFVQQSITADFCAVPLKVIGSCFTGRRKKQTLLKYFEPELQIPKKSFVFFSSVRIHA